MLKDISFEEFKKIFKIKNSADPCIEENFIKKRLDYPGGAIGRDESGKKRDAG